MACDVTPVTTSLRPAEKIGHGDNAAPGFRPSDLDLVSPALEGMRAELALIGTVMNRITHVIDAPGLRRVRQMRSQLFDALATLVLTGPPGAETGILARILSGAQSPQSETASLFLQPLPVPGMQRTPLPIDLLELPEAIDPARLSDRAAQCGMLDTEICVAVFPAPRLLTADDLLLIRFIRGNTGKNTLLFISQIDCLENPTDDIAAIRARIAAIAARHGAAAVPTVLFGSLDWAQAAMADTLDMMPMRSQDALLQLAAETTLETPCDAPAIAWRLSGLPALAAEIGRILADGPLRRAMAKARRQLRMTLLGSEPDPAMTVAGFSGTVPVLLSKAEIVHRAEHLARRLQAELRSETAVLVGEFRTRMAKAGNLFVDTAVAEMIAHMEREGAPIHWEVDPVRLRIQLRAACLGFAQSCHSLTDRMLQRAARELAVLYRELLGADAVQVMPEPPLGAFVSVPALDGRMISVDLQAGSWRWRLRASQNGVAQIREFKTRVMTETVSLLEEVEERHKTAPVDAVRTTLGAFLQAQTDALAAMARAGEVTAGTVNRALFGEYRYHKAALRAAALEALEAATAGGRPSRENSGGN